MGWVLTRARLPSTPTVKEYTETAEGGRARLDAHGRGGRPAEHVGYASSIPDIGVREDLEVSEVSDA
jgi:hypothetical protein